MVVIQRSLRIPYRTPSDYEGDHWIERHASGRQNLVYYSTKSIEKVDKKERNAQCYSVLFFINVYLKRNLELLQVFFLIAKPFFIYLNRYNKLVFGKLNKSM